MLDVQSQANVLVAYLRSLPDFRIVDVPGGNYHHMGATITDAVLQAGVKYDTVVRPRVAAVRRDFPDATTTSAFLRLLQGTGAKTVLRWKDDEKPNRVIGLTEFLHGRQIETEEQLGEWMKSPENRGSLLRVRGVGPKTRDYLWILVGGQTAAVDMHLFAILDQAGISHASYDKARQIIGAAADILGCSRALFDHSIWRYASSRKQVPQASASGGCKHAGGSRREAPRSNQ